jgi:hypothetical protein
VSDVLTEAGGTLASGPFGRVSEAGQPTLARKARCEFEEALLASEGIVALRSNDDGGVSFTSAMPSTSDLGHVLGGVLYAEGRPARPRQERVRRILSARRDRNRWTT